MFTLLASDVFEQVTDVFEQITDVFEQVTDVLEQVTDVFDQVTDNPGTSVQPSCLAEDVTSSSLRRTFGQRLYMYVVSREIWLRLLANSSNSSLACAACRIAKTCTRCISEYCYDYCRNAV